MKLLICSAVCATTLMLTSTAWGQSHRVDLAGVSAALGLSTITAPQPAPGPADTIKQELRNTVAQVFVNMVQQIFGDLRTNLGLPAVPTGFALDPLALLEVTIEDAIRASVGY